MTKILSIFRHAEAKYNPRCSDHLRPLSLNGVADAGRMAKHLTGMVAPIDRVFCSDAGRTLETWQILNQTLSVSAEHIIFDPSLYLANSADLIARVETLSNEWQHVALVGHNPGLTSLCNFYTGDALCDLPTGSHYCVGFEVDDWRATSRLMGVLLNFTVPQQLKP
jgi:phosphohistidine phosphatase